MSPSVTLGLLLGSIYGLLGHLFVGRAWRELPVYWLVAVAGFFAGFMGAVLLGVETVRLGTVPLVEATLGSLLALATAGWLLRRRAMPRGEAPSSRPARTPSQADPAGYEGRTTGTEQQRKQRGAHRAGTAGRG